MKAAFADQRSRRIHEPARARFGPAGGRALRALLTLLLAGLLVGCNGDEGAAAGSAENPAAAPAEPAERLPVYDIASGLRAEFPEVVAFLDEFLNTCLVGDYAGYRRLVSRAYTPESRERFEAIYRATEAVLVESIERIEVPRIPPPVYVVISAVELDPRQHIKLRETHREVAILVFVEGGEWRMAPAPAELQPKREPPPTTTSAPTTSTPAYPWDEDGDY